MQEDTDPQKLYSGPLVAASLSLLLAFLTLMVSHHISRLTRELDNIVHAYGHWIPGSTGSGPDGSIGSYSGKETLALGVWLSSWLIFHFLWRRQELSVRAWTRIFVIGLLAITLGFFHPLSDPVVLFIAGLFGIA
ncbi:hypothetical protein NP590_07140 [Methylomonas sp. SURF-2]|uniref:PAP2 superfamily protein n=1 Tax=Methylomonas subterranea TaxID=2952225 RepID=A0ABT1TEI3_9GAMM|nr:hypothetical protein [Methylomonas sp. SURF-2]MCQ8103874.1 hypothetical protein [Methylomonas sp. SURF-2]